jgi:hypothetical protein
MIRVVAALVGSNGAMPTIAQVRHALGDAARAFFGSGGIQIDDSPHWEGT